MCTEHDYVTAAHLERMVRTVGTDWGPYLEAHGYVGYVERLVPELELIHGDDCYGASLRLAKQVHGMVALVSTRNPNAGPKPFSWYQWWSVWYGQGR